MAVSWKDETTWPKTWDSVSFSPIILEGDEYIVYFGGYGPQRDFYKYNLSTGVFTSLADLPISNSIVGPLSMSPSRTKLINKYVNSDALYIYDIASNTWSTSSAAPTMTGLTTPMIQTHCFEDDDTVWVQVRCYYGATWYVKIYKYVISTDTWTQYGNSSVQSAHNGYSMTMNTAKTVVFVGHVGADNYSYLKYTIASDNYATTSLSANGWVFPSICPISHGKLWVGWGTGTSVGLRYLDCDTDTVVGSEVFEANSDQTKYVSNMAAGVYDINLIIAHTLSASPYNQSYPVGALPIVTTQLTTDIADTTATGNGTIVDEGDSSVTEYGHCWSTSPLPTLDDNYTIHSGSHTGAYTSSLVGLTENTLYYVRAYATNSYGTAYGEVTAFTTFTTMPTDAPEVTTEECTDVGQTVATGHGTIVSIGGSAVTEHGHCWGTSPYPTTSDSKTTLGAGSVGSLQSNLTSLSPDTTYYVRAYATNTDGTGYGDNVTITTEAATTPTIQTGFAIDQSIITEFPSFDLITDDLISVYIKRGRMHDLNRIEAGTATLILKNLHGYYWRYNTSSPYYPNLKPLMLVSITREYNGTTYNRFYGVVESFKHGWRQMQGAKVPIVTVSCVDMFKSLNRMKLYALPGTVGAYTNVVALKSNASSGQKVVAIKSLGDSATEGCDIKYLHVGQTVTIGDTSNSETNTIASIDENAYELTMTDNLSNTYVAGSSKNGYVKKFPQALSGIRVADVLYELDWPAALMELDTGQLTVAELVPGTDGENALGHIQDVAESEGGIVFQAGDGKITFQDRDARLSSPYNTSQATFSDNGNDQVYSMAEPEDDDTMIYNECLIDGDGITGQLYRDYTTQEDQGPRTFSRTGSLLVVDADAFDQAYQIVRRYRDSILRIPRMTVYPDADPANLYPLVLAWDISTRINLEMDEDPNPAGIDKDYHIEGIEEYWGAGSLYEVTFQLWDVNLFRVFQAEHTGYLEKQDADYDTAHDAANADTAYDDQSVIVVGQLNDGANYYIARGFLQFDTSAIGATATIQAAEIIVEITGPFVVDNEWDLVIVEAGSGVTNPLDVADYGTMESQGTSLGSVTIETPEVNTKIIVFTLNATGIAAISKTGTTYFGIRSSRDISQIAPGASETEAVNLEVTNFNPRLIVELNEAF